jgi:uncharacterized coiled-coil protein SlyX
MCQCSCTPPAPDNVLSAFTYILTTLNRIETKLEEHMATEVEQFTALSTKFDDLVADVRAALEALATAVSPEGQAILDSLNARLDAFDTEVGDADGSDTPPPPPVV